MTDAALHRQLKKQLQKPGEMGRFMDHLFGAGNWRYYPDDDVWVAPDARHIGPGHGYCIVQRDGTWFTAVLPEAKD
jgi:hypothetical protein